MTIIWCMVPEMWSVTDRVLHNFGPFFPLLSHLWPGKSKLKKNEKNSWSFIFLHIIFLHNVHYKWQSYDVWFLKYGGWQTEIFVILDHFLPFYSPPLTIHKIKILKKWKNSSRYYHFTHVWHKWQSYDVWFLQHGAQKTKFLSFWAIFCPFTNIMTWKINILKT